ncbi:MAG: AI-2E family transporter [Alphaproteobacteria bacterium]|nr:AI-2E family transporter [Alphaproteobacteria bacterium]
MGTIAGAGRWRFWVLLALAVLAALWLLNDVLLPFTVGAVIAYFADPVVARLQRHGLSRTAATAVVTGIATALAIGALVAAVPLLFEQVQKLALRAPSYAARFSAQVMPLLEMLRDQFGMEAPTLGALQAEAQKHVGEVVAAAGKLLASLALRGAAVVNFLGLLFVTPVVAFYLLRDWEAIVARVDSWLPRDHAPTIRKLARESDGAVAGFVRGQALVCVFLAAFYGIGLHLVGLEFGFVVGLLAGAISFVPFVGTLAGLVVGVGMALAQFPPAWIPVGLVVAVFAAGQALEGNFLQPHLVGDRVGLHPVWIMFALLAAGSLFGLLGVMLAVPVAAILGVVVRHFLARYLESDFYRGDGDG